MSSKEDGAMIVLSSPSGAGKTTLTKLLSENDNYLRSISHTTRKPRANEINSRDYYFVNEVEFKSLIKKDEFLEHAKVFNHLYGTSKSYVFKSLDKGKNVKDSVVVQTMRYMELLKELKKSGNKKQKVL